MTLHPEKLQCAILRALGVDPDVTVEAWIHLVPGDMVEVQTRQYVLDDEGAIQILDGEVAEVVKRYELTEVNL